MTTMYNPCQLTNTADIIQTFIVCHGFAGFNSNGSFCCCFLFITDLITSPARTKQRQTKYVERKGGSSSFCTCWPVIM